MEMLLENRSKLWEGGLTVVGVFKKEGDDMMGMSQDKNALIPLEFR
jgi:hypothetical protein